MVAHQVQHRTHEVGIRMALGASRLQVLRLVVREGMAAAFVGLVLGLGGAFVLTRTVSALLFGISPTDMTTGPVLLVFVAFCACLLPAVRATNVDLVVALRYE